MNLIEQAARTEANKRDSIIKLIKIAATILLPAFITLLSLYGGDIFNSWKLSLLFAIIVLVQIGFAIFLLFKEERNDRLYFLHKDVSKALENLKIEFNKQIDAGKQSEYMKKALELGSDALLKFIVANVNKQVVQIDEIQQAVGNIIRPFVDFRENIFNSNISNKHNFAVYLVARDSQTLCKFYRVADDRIPQTNRPWRVGVGHIGVCFALKQTIISPDISKESEFLGDLSEDDYANYRSIASTPIYCDIETLETSEAVRGVFIATSSIPGQFTKTEHRYFIAGLANLLSILFIFTDNKLPAGEDYVKLPPQTKQE